MSEDYLVLALPACGVREGRRHTFVSFRPLTGTWRARVGSMNALRYTLLSDGSSERALIYPINRLLVEHAPRAFEARWADLGRLRRRPNRARRPSA